MAVNDGHMVDHTYAFGGNISQLRGAFSATVNAAVGNPKGGGGKTPTLEDLDEPVNVPTIQGEFGRPRPKNSKPTKYKA